MKKNLNILSILFFLGTVATFAQVFTKNGTVSPGTPSDFYELHVSSNSINFTLLSGQAPGILFSRTATNSLALPAIGLSTSNTNYHSTSISGDFNIRGGAARDIVFGTLNSASSINGDERMRIKNNGNVGIGVINPESKLHVDGTITTPSFKTNQRGVIKIKDFSKGEVQYNRALFPVYDASLNRSELVINYNGDFENGVKIAGTQLSVDGELGVGTTDTRGYKLAVNGNILTEELKIRTYANWPDYVFTSTYNLKPLKEVEDHINKKGHLPNIPSAEDVKENGFNIGEMNAKLLEKIEELTLYVIKQQKDIESLKKSNSLLVNSIKTRN